MMKEEMLGDTPFVALDLSIMEHNIAFLSNLAKKGNVKLRPHTKTHKSVYIAKKQLEAGAIGVTTATLGEAEIMADAGINDIVIAFPIIGKRKLERLGNLIKRAKITVALDDIFVAEGLNRLGKANNQNINVYVDIDTGNHRMGRSAQDSIEPILEIASLPYINIVGLMSHAGHAYFEKDYEKVKNIAIEDATILHETKEKLVKKGIEIKEISVGATATAGFIDQLPYITEVRAGMYVFNDLNVMVSGFAKDSDCAISILATVISRPAVDRLIIDSGSKTLSYDPNLEGGFGKIKGYNQLKINRLSEEHGIVEINGECDLNVGDVIEIIPNHVCPVINLTDEVYGFRNNELEQTITIDARGKTR